MNSEQLQVLQDRLAKGLTIFTYTKKDGSERVAFGTTNRDLIPPISKKSYDRQMEIIKQEIAKIQTGVLPNEPIDEVPVREALMFLDNYFNKEKKAGNTPEGFIHYWDFEAADWRMFSKDNFLHILNAVQTK